MNQLIPIEKNNQRVLLSTQLADWYGVSTRNIVDNFNNNMERYCEGKDYFKLEGDELKSFKRKTENFVFAKNLNKLYLWTEHGALLHAKSIGTDKAWEVYSELVDTYFRAKDIQYLPTNYLEALKALVASEEEKQSLLVENGMQQQLIAEFSPKATYYDLVLQTKDVIAISSIAKDYGKSAKWMNEKLHELGVQFKRGDTWLLYQKYAKLGYTHSKTHTYSGDDGEQHSSVHTYWTQKGRRFIYDLLKSEGIYPLIEIEDNLFVC